MSLARRSAGAGRKRRVEFTFPSGRLRRFPPPPKRERKGPEPDARRRVPGRGGGPRSPPARPEEAGAQAPRAPSRPVPSRPGPRPPAATPGPRADTHPSPTTTHLMACIWAACWAAAEAATGHTGEKRRARGARGRRARGCGRQDAGCRGRSPRRLAFRLREAEAQQRPPPKAGEIGRETGNGRSTHIRPSLPRAGAPKLGAGPSRPRAPGTPLGFGRARGCSGALGDSRDRSDVLGRARHRPSARGAIFAR